MRERCATGAKGTRSGVHVDPFASHFWMLMIAGQKRWGFVLPESDMPEQAQRAYLYEDRAHQSFDGDLFAPDFAQHPLLARVKMVTATLAPGELLFVPAETPHQVENLEDSVALSGNFINIHNLERSMLHLQKEARAGHAPSARLFAGLRGVKARTETQPNGLLAHTWRSPVRDEEPAAQEDVVDLSWRDFKRERSDMGG